MPEVPSYVFLNFPPVHMGEHSMNGQEIFKIVLKRIFMQNALFIYQFWCKINLITVYTRNASSTTYQGEYIKHSHDNKEHNVIDDPHYNLQLLHQNVIHS